MGHVPVTTSGPGAPEATKALFNALLVSEGVCTDSAESGGPGKVQRWRSTAPVRDPPSASLYLSA